MRWDGDGRIGVEKKITVREWGERKMGCLGWDGGGWGHCRLVESEVGNEFLEIEGGGAGREGASWWEGW